MNVRADGFEVPFPFQTSLGAFVTGKVVAIHLLAMMARAQTVGVSGLGQGRSEE